jgi:flagellar assembly factor FliW
MTVNTHRFGPLEIEDAAVLHFPHGLYGLPQSKRFCAIPHDSAPGIQWLQSVDQPEVALMVTDPFPFFPDYELIVPDDLAGTLQAEHAGDLLIYVTLTTDSKQNAVYANLLGPVVVNPNKGLAAQVAQDSSRYSVRHQLTAPKPGRRAA